MAAKTTYLNTKQLKSAIKHNSLRAQHEGNRSYLIGVQTKVLQAKYDKASGSDKATLGRMIETYKGSQKAHIAAHKKYAAKVKAEKATLAKRSTAAKVQANKNKIAGKIANNKPKFNTGHMMLYRTDGHSSAIVFMSSVPESEDNTVQVTPNALPKGEPTATHSQQTEKDISITARIMGTDAQQRTAFNQLLKWKAEGCEMTYKGRIYYKHCLFTALHREYNKDETALTITFGLQFIDWSELKTSGKSASSGTKSKTNNKPTAKKYVTTKLGTTYASLADDYNTTIAKLISMNSYKSAVNVLPVGVKIRVS
jgi:hypothetical protein